MTGEDVLAVAVFIAVIVGLFAFMNWFVRNYRGDLTIIFDAGNGTVSTYIVDSRCATNLMLEVKKIEPPSSWKLFKQDRFTLAINRFLDWVLRIKRDPELVSLFDRKFSFQAKKIDASHYQINSLGLPTGHRSGRDYIDFPTPMNLEDGIPYRITYRTKYSEWEMVFKIEDGEVFLPSR